MDFLFLIIIIIIIVIITIIILIFTFLQSNQTIFPGYIVLQHFCIYSLLLLLLLLLLLPGADKSLALPTSRCILFDGENISFDASLVICISIALIFLQL